MDTVLVVNVNDTISLLQFSDHTSYVSVTAQCCLWFCVAKVRFTSKI